MAATGKDEPQRLQKANRGKRPRGPVATTVGIISEILITAGVILALFAVYSLWWTNVLADREAKQEGDRVRNNWATSSPQPTPSKPGTEPRALDTKDGVGFLHVPAMKNGEVLIKSGTSSAVLNEGVAGYYHEPVKAAMPWEKEGNFTLAAHRDGHGAKFHNIDKIKVGDPVIVETRDVWYIYKVYAELQKTSPSNVGVLSPIPKESGVTKPGRYLTLTTCTPVYTSDYRYVVWAQWEREEKVDDKRTPPKELR
ncbi:class E sortase [Streptomyces klenkii]|uniref:class E sortase n=1 Tax=Streptomyces klenkii TaxID=1420899 RepID=UPI00342E07CD